LFHHLNRDFTTCLVPLGSSVSGLSPAGRMTVGRVIGWVCERNRETIPHFLRLVLEVNRIVFAVNACLGHL
jgi:hypothetical protein